ncbi:MAG: NusG domain II-containing protein [Anaerovoracaceae bacterium]
MIKKADIILAVFLIAAGLAMSYIISFGKTAGDELKVTANGKIFGYYPLAENREIEIKQNEHINKITIKDGKVSMSFSDCRGQDCIHQHPISKTGETIVCLPNKVILEITGNEDEYDSIAK